VPFELSIIGLQYAESGRARHGLLLLVAGCEIACVHRDAITNSFGQGEDSQIPASIGTSSILNVRAPIASLRILRILHRVSADRIDIFVKKTKS
jgi:hypothetical protein